ncbi:MAG: carbohydrate kinase family protein [Verrucomicrobiae bacterium]|nr:carbohydrate kinase family protein [Verrucomicrobiae bacterium]
MKTSRIRQSTTVPVEKKRITVCCAGILVADTFCGPMKKLPSAGQLLSVETMPSKAGGCAANVAINLARQGFVVEVAGRLGRDSAARFLVDCFAAHHIGTRNLTWSECQPTSKTVVLIVEGQDRRYLHHFGANREFTVGQMDRTGLENCGVFYLGGLFAMPSLKSGELLDLLKFCRNRGVTSVIDVVVPQSVKGMAELKPLLPHIDWFLPNDDEAFQFTGVRDPLGQLRIFREVGAHNIVITRGKKGAVVAQGDTYWHAGVYSMKAIDCSGSGDAFSSGMITGILRGWDMPRTLRHASALGASATRAIGTTAGVFDSAEAETFIATHALPLKTGRF